MKNLLIGCGQITWRGAEFSEHTVLEEIAAAGYAGAPVNAASLDDVDRLAKLYENHGLLPAPGYFGGAFWDANQSEALVSEIKKKAEISAAFGLTQLYVAANGVPARRDAAGHVSAADALLDAQYAIFAETLNRSGEAALQHGVQICFHNHVGTYIETRSEIDELFGRVDRSLVFQGPDTGHLAWAGDDVVPFVRDYGRDIQTLHLKDIDPAVRARGLEERWDYPTASAHGIFTELGRGLVDFPGVFKALGEAGFEGWLIVETDVTQLPTAKESAVVSRNYLKSLGM